MRDESSQSVVAALLEDILPLEPRLEERLHEGIEVLDVGCGAGKALMCLAAAFPQSHFLRL